MEINKLKVIAIGCDHAGFPYKSMVLDLLKAQGYEVKDFGTFSTESVDYPDYVHPLCNAVEENLADAGILLCGSGNGVCMSANKHQKIRAALCWGNEVAELARQHNDANVICIPARFVDKETAISMVNIFLKTPFEGGRHKKRVEKISVS